MKEKSKKQYLVNYTSNRLKVNELHYNSSLKIQDMAARLSRYAIS